MWRWQSSALLRRLLFLLLPIAALQPLNIYGLVLLEDWVTASLVAIIISAMTLAPSMSEVVRAVWIYFSRPTFRPATVAANANPVLHSGIKRLSYLQLSPETLTDVLAYLPRCHFDACQLVCRDFRHTIDERARDLPVYEMTVGLTDDATLIQYLATVPGRGSVEGCFFYGLRTSDRPYFRNAALTIDTCSGSSCYLSAMNLVSVEILECFLQGLSLDERNLRIWALTFSAYANEAPNIFQYARSRDIPLLDISYEYCRKHPASDFIAAVFKEARSNQMPVLYVSIEDAGALSCVAVDALGRKLISEILAHSQAPVADYLFLTLPQLGSYPLISRLIEALGHESSPMTRMDVSLKFPSSVSLAELWPDHSDYFNMTRKEASMQRWQATVLLRLLLFLLLCAALPLLAIRVVWMQKDWTGACLFAIMYAMELAVLQSGDVRTIWKYYSRPTFRPVPAAANANPVLQSGVKRLKRLQLSPWIVTDALGYLPRSGVDACQRVSREFRQVIDAHARDLPLYRMNVVFKLTCSVYAKEAADIFHLARACDIPSLSVSYVYQRKSPATNFIAAVFEEACSSRLSEFVVSVKDVSTLSCVAVDALGRKLISRILAHCQTPVAQLLVLTLPRLGSCPLISRLIELTCYHDRPFQALGRESAPRTRMDVSLKFPSSVSLAELWPDHSDYFNETLNLWSVPLKHGLITMCPTASASDTTTYIFLMDPVLELLA